MIYIILNLDDQYDLLCDSDNNFSKSKLNLLYSDGFKAGCAARRPLTGALGLRTATERLVREVLRVEAFSGSGMRNLASIAVCSNLWADMSCVIWAGKRPLSADILSTGSSVRIVTRRSSARWGTAICLGTLRNNV